jgi:hypothetical protein
VQQKIWLNSLTSHEMKSYNELMKTNLAQDEPQVEAQSDRSSIKCEFEVIKENIF